MELASLITITIVLIPILATPGPANLAHFSIGCAGGTFRALPFFLGVNTAVLFWATLLFWGAGSLVSAPWFPVSLMQNVGAIYMAYLGYSICTNGTDSDGETTQYVPGFKQGFVLQILNPKLFALIFLVLSQSPGADGIWIVLFICYFVFLNMVPHAAYLFLGHIGSDIGSLQSRNRFSGSLLIIVALWMLFSAS